MNSTEVIKTGSTILLVILGLCAAIVIWAALSGHKVPLISGERQALITITILGVIMCGLGMKINIYGWLNPITITGCVIGAVMLLIITSAFAGFKLPWIVGDRAAILSLALLGGVKIILDILRTIIYR